MQLALLTAAVKLFIYKAQSDTSKALVHKVLKWATEEVDNPDLRDRGFMYWRLLAINPTVAGEIVLAEKPAITTDSDRMDRGALDQLLLHTGTLGSIYHKNPEVRRSFHAFMLSSHSHIRQTFIRNAAGKALTDSPALNPLSRQVLVPLSRPNIPPAIHVPGPGPPPPREASVSPVPPTAKPAPPAPPQTGDLIGASSSADTLDGEGENEHESGEHGDEDSLASPSGSADPYANLDNAFGSYLADEPKPQADDHLTRLF